jgi:hypothetical protein
MRSDRVTADREARHPDAAILQQLSKNPRQEAPSCKRHSPRRAGSVLAQGTVSTHSYSSYCSLKGERIKMNYAIALVAITFGLVTSLTVSGAAQAPPTPDQMVAALKQNLAESQKRLRSYEWVETTSISLKGEEKSRKQQRVYYGADGKLTKIPLGEPPPQAAPSGGRGRGRLKEKIVENKKDDMKEYMERAASLIHLYVPPNPAQIQQAKDKGNMAMRAQPQGMRVEFQNFIQPSDMLAIDVDAKAALLSALTVATYLDKPEDAVTLAVRFGALGDGTSYTAQTTLDAKAKSIRVVVENSGHRPLQ